VRLSGLCWLPSSSPQFPQRSDGQPHAFLIRPFRKIWSRCIDAAAVVPQTRKRVYIVGIRDDVVSLLDTEDGFEFPFPDFEATEGEGPSLLDVLEDETSEVRHTLARPKQPFSVVAYAQGCPPELVGD